MNWFDYTLLVLWILGILATPATIGKRRPVRSPGQGTFLILWMLALIVGLLFSRGVLTWA